MIELTVHGDPAACRATSADLTALATAVGATGQEAGDAAARTDGAWNARSADLFRRRVEEIRCGVDDLHGRVRRLATALEGFAGELATVEARMTSVRGIAQAAGLSVVGDVVHPPTAPAPTADAAAVDAHNARVERYNDAFAIAEDARGVESRAHSMLVDEVKAVTRDGFLEELLRKLGFLPKNPSGAVDHVLWGGGLGLFGLGFTSDWMAKVQYGRFAPRGPGGRFVPLAAPWHVNAVRALDPDNWTARPYQGATRQTWSTVGKWGQRAGFVVSFGTAAFDQWQADADDPSLSTSAQVGRAATKGATTAAGGWAGAWAGAQVGGAVGTAIGGPVGTVVGGAVGGLVGGVVGSGVGSAVGDAAVDVAGDTADAIGDAAGSAADALTFWD